MSRASELLTRLKKEDAGAHTQTIRISQRHHQRLRALSDYLNESKTAIASRMVEDYIDEAFEALPDDEEVPDVIVPEEYPPNQSRTVRAYYQWVAEKYYSELPLQNLAESKP